MTDDLRTYLLTLIFMVFAHLIADYPLQGWLAQAKCKDYWADKGGKCRYDYVPALIGHSLMWSIALIIPILVIFDYDGMFAWVFVVPNALIHYLIDDAKANKKKLNLCQDQLLHLAQIVATWVITVLVVELWFF